MTNPSKKQSILPRFIHRVYAFMMGYFWLPCPICGRYYGGHEIKSKTSILYTSLCGGKCVCPSRGCEEEAQKLNEKYFLNNSSIGVVV